MKERVEVIRAMETIARCVNDEDVFDYWLVCGVADGAIDENTEDNELAWYAMDTNFSYLMGTFLRLMTKAKASGGLYVDGVLSRL